MYVLLEIADEYVIIFGIIAFIIVLTLGVVFLAVSKKDKVKPISENERFESDDEKIEFKKIEDLTDEQKKAREELERVFNRMNEDLQKETETVVDTFEREQEENAIISYQELIKQVKGVKEESDDVVAKIEKSEVKKEPINPITFDESNIEPTTQNEKDNYLEALNDLKNNIKAASDIEPERKPYSGSITKFNTSEIISPIYGRQTPVSEESFNVSETYQVLNEENEQKQNSEFLNSLKEFRNNLE